MFSSCVECATHKTTEGLFSSLDEKGCRSLADKLSEEIARAAMEKIAGTCDLSVGLVNMAGELLGTHGDLVPWQ